MLHGFDDYAPTTSADLHYEARTIPGADLLFARTLPELAPRQRGEVELGLLVMQEFPGLGPVETVRRERWLVWAAIAWPFADLSHGGGYGGAALLLGERLRSDGVPDGLLLVLEWRRFTRIESEPAAAGLADILAAWRPRYGLQVCYAALDEREPAYLARLRRSPAMRRLRLGAVEVDAAEASYLLGARLEGGTIGWTQDLDTVLRADTPAHPSAPRRALLAGLIRAEQIERSG